MGSSDGALIGPNGIKEPIEVKGSRCKKGKDNTVFVNDIRLDGTDWQHLFIVSRRRSPDKWTDYSEYGKCGFRLAYVKRRDLLRAAQASGRAHLAKVNATRLQEGLAGAVSLPGLGPGYLAGMVGKTRAL